MRRFARSIVFRTWGTGTIAVALTAGAWAQAAADGGGKVRQQSSSVTSEPAPDRPTGNFNRPPANFNRPPGNINRPPENFNRPPPNYNRTPRMYNDAPDSRGADQRKSTHDVKGPAPDANTAPDRRPDRSGRDRDRDRAHDRDHSGYRRRPVYYDPWAYDRYLPYDGYVPYDDRYRPYGDGYRGWEEDGGYNAEPVDARESGKNADPAPPDPMLPPEDLLDDSDQPPELRKALETSAAYREATADLLRAWADYARAAEQVLQRLRGEPAYRKAQSDLRDAEAKVASLRDRGNNVPAVNLVSAAQQAMMARRTVRMLEEKAYNADPAARKAKEQVDQAVERRKKVREEIAAKLPAGAQ
jgi:hypothetical protein